jgi:hypothetical protein
MNAETDAVYRDFLQTQHEAAQALAAASDILTLHVPPSGAPARYVASFRSAGLVRAPDGRIVEADQADFGIWMPEDYLRRVSSYQVFTYLGPYRSPWHPNIHPAGPFVCVNNLRPGHPLPELLNILFELWTWRVFATKDDGLNPDASQWARHQPPERFPIDPRPLRRRAARPAAAAVGTGGAP